MTLEELGLKKAEITKLNKKGIMTVEDIQQFYPRTYYDFSEVKTMHPSLNGQFCAIYGKFIRMETQKTNETLMLKAKVLEQGTEKKLHVMWIGNYYLKNVIKDWEGQDVIVCGKLTYEDTYHSFHMNNPVIFSPDINKNLKVYPVYTKMSGISEEWMSKIISKALEVNIEDNLPDEIIRRWKLPSMNEAVYSMHSPKTMKQLERAQRRIIFNTLYDFAHSMEEKNMEVSKGSVYNIKASNYAKDYIKMLPFKLTQSQRDAISEMDKLARDGRRINALIQGDVGSGKTAVAFTMMLLFVSSGYQSVLMAPTEILARQHYEEIKGYCDKLGLNVVFLTGSLKASEKKEILSGIKEGKAQIIVGTHSAASKDVEYKDLALAVVDEEHRFGVNIENDLFGKSDKGMHTITMSATPIPRTIADVLFSGNTSVFDLTRPEGRQEVQTAIFNNDKKIAEFAEKQIKEGRQIYVVCPLIETTEKSEKGNLLSVEDTEKLYQKLFEGKNIRIASVTGKTKVKEQEAILEQFKNGDIDILIATTVIEVGVNTPNASTIIINNAERFGVAQLHQLRGRVGRGGYKGYCILKSAEKDNERLQLLCRSNNGFELAEEDAKLRGPGDILGERQSGESKELELVLKFPKVYDIAKKEAKKQLSGII